MADWLELMEAPLPMERVNAHLEDPGAGGRVVFSGHVRPLENGETIEALHYEQFPAMAEKQMKALSGEMHDRWPIIHLAIVHRVGKVPVGEAAVIIGVACGHRREAFEAAEYAIDRLKEIVPIWKGTEGA